MRFLPSNERDLLADGRRLSLVGILREEQQDRFPGESANQPKRRLR
jgi:hypothetical protein